MFAYLFLFLCYYISKNYKYNLSGAVHMSMADAKEQLNVEVSRSLKRELKAHLALAGMPIGRWVEGVIREFLAHGAQKSRVHTVLHDLQDK